MMSESEDSRLEHIKNTVISLLNVSNDHWLELIWKEENQAIIKDFLDTPTTVFLLIFLDQNEKLFVSLEMPSARFFPKVMAYFTKNNPIVSSENCKEEIMFGNIGDFPLDHYQNLFEEVLYPIFSNALNNSRWPTEIASDIILHFQDFRRSLTYHVSLDQGKTTLIIPETAKLIKNYDIQDIYRDKIDWELYDVINSITDMVSDWNPIIREVLEVTSESILLKIRQGPATEIKFWNDRRKNLEFIQKQLNDPVIEKMMYALQKIENVHYPLFKNLLQDVVEALDEAKEISQNLSAMSDELKKFETTEFSRLKNFPEVMKQITLAWSNSKYFSKVPSRISVLIQKCCFFLMEKIEGYLNPTDLFKAEETKMKNNVEECIEICRKFLQSYSDCQKSFTEDEIYPWKFPDERIFGPFEKFLDRLNKVNEIFEASALYSSIPDYKILGIQQVTFKMRLDELSNLFKEYYQIFAESTYNVLDLKSDVFLEDFNLFFLKVDELDHKLGTTLSQVCLSCTISGDSFKLMKLVQELIKRPLVNLAFKKLITSLLNNVYTELLTAKESYDSLLLALESDTQIIYKNVPTTTGELQWSIDLQKKLSFSVDSLQQFQDYYINTDDADLILRTYKEMDELLQNFQTEIFSKWDMSLDIIKKQLDEPIFKDEKDNLLVNFSPQIVDIAQDIQYAKMKEKIDLLPSDAIELYESLKTIILAQSLLAYAVRWYNDLKQNLMDFEIMIIKDEWEKVSNDFKKGLEEKWTKSDLKEYSENAYQTTKFLYENINKARENVREVQVFIETWNKSPIFVRETPDSLVDFEVFMTPEMSEQIYHVIETSISMNQAMQANLLLFKSNPESDEWKNYVLYLDSIIETGLIDSVECSLQYIAENTNKFNKKLAPFCKIRMILKEDVAFVPSLDKNQLGNFSQLFITIIKRIYSPASKINRLINSEMDYLEAITEDNGLNSLKNQVIEQVKSGIQNTLNELVNYQRYSDLWQENINDDLEYFILYGPPPEIKPDEEEIEPEDVSLEIKPPSEEEFKTQITQFDMLQKKIEDIPSETVIDSWIQLDITSFKESLSSLIRIWSTAYKKKFMELKSQGKLRKVEDNGD